MKEHAGIEICGAEMLAVFMLGMSIESEQPHPDALISSQILYIEPYNKHVCAAFHRSCF